MQHKLVSKKLALLAKERNFDQATNYFTSPYNSEPELNGTERNWNELNNHVSYPTVHQLQDWVKFTHNIIVFVVPRLPFDWDSPEYMCHYMEGHKGGKSYKLKALTYNKNESGFKYFTSEEVALDAGLLHALDLIPKFPI